MLLTDAEKAEAKRLGLTQREASVSLAWRIPLTRYAELKQEIASERAAWEQRLTGMSDAMLERARYMPEGRGERPWPKESPPDEDGG